MLSNGSGWDCYSNGASPASVENTYTQCSTNHSRPVIGHFSNKRMIWKTPKSDLRKSRSQIMLPPRRIFVCHHGVAHCCQRNPIEGIASQLLDVGIPHPICVHIPWKSLNVQVPTRRQHAVVLVRVDQIAGRQTCDASLRAKSATPRQHLDALVRPRHKILHQFLPRWCLRQRWD